MNKSNLIGTIVMLGVALMPSCNNETKNSNNAISASNKVEVQSIGLISKEVGIGKLKANCYSCHNPNSESHDDMLAPPLAAIKYKYKELYPEEGLFIANMSAFVDSPSKEKAIMKGPVKRFGLMPKTALSTIEVQEIVKYIYHNKLETPEWFPEHFEEKHDTKWKDKHKH